LCTCKLAKYYLVAVITILIQTDVEKALANLKE